ncbi:MAG: Crp/Fnr family transcriptional regulator, partial [Prevotella sp.]
FLLSGRMEVSAQAHDNGYTFTEDIGAPYILQPENLFGISPRYTRTFVAKATCSLLLLSKSEVLRLTDDFIIFKFNLLNTISTQAQKAERLPWRHCAPNLEHRITRFITTHCTHPAGSKLVHIKMQKLANELNDNRLNVSRALNGMQKQGLIQLKRGCIVIPMLEKLVAEWG